MASNFIDPSLSNMAKGGEESAIFRLSKRLSQRESGNIFYTVHETVRAQLSRFVTAWDDETGL